MAAAAPVEPFDVFLSHHSADKPFVRLLRDELVRLGLTAWFDERELPAQDNFVEGLSADGLNRCRFLVLIVTQQSLERPWVKWEWTNFMALSGPLGRIIPVPREAVALPPALAATQGLHAAGKSAAEVAALVALRVGRLRDLPDNDLRRLALGQLLAFDLRCDGDGLVVAGPDGTAHPASSPLAEAAFRGHLGAFRRLVRTELTSDAERADLVRCATALGRALFDLLPLGAAHLRQAGARPLLTLCADADLLELPWELLHDGNGFLMRDGVIDLVRTTRDEVHETCLLTPPTGPFTLVVNVSAPANCGGLENEKESYRLTRALTEHCPMTPTELGTLADLVATIQRQGPVGVHFSGHGGPGTLLFEDDDGERATVAVTELVERLRRELRERLPAFFYLACCHGNDGGAEAESAAAVLHGAGVTQVVGYSGPIVDELSTRAEETLYAALAAGQTTRQAVREARAALGEPGASATGGRAGSVSDGESGRSRSRLMEVCVRFEQEIGHPDAAKDAAHVAELRQRLAGQAPE